MYRRIETKKSMMFAVLVVALSVFFLASCGRGDDAKQMLEKAKALEAENAILSAKVKELAETEPNLFQRCEESIYKLGDHVKSEDNPALDATVQICERFVMKFSPSQRSEVADQIVIKVKQMQHAFSVSDEIGKLLSAGQFGQAKRMAETLRGEVDENMINGILEKIKESENAPALINVDELDKLVSTGMTIGRKYRVYAKLSDDGTYFEAGSRNPMDYRPKFINIYEQLNHEKSVNLYDLRRKFACFFVHMEYGGKLMLDDFNTTSGCDKIANNMINLDFHLNVH